MEGDWGGVGRWAHCMFGWDEAEERGGGHDCVSMLGAGIVLAQAQIQGPLPQSVQWCPSEQWEGSKPASTQRSFRVKGRLHVAGMPNTISAGHVIGQKGDQSLHNPEQLVSGG